MRTLTHEQCSGPMQIYLRVGGTSGTPATLPRAAYTYNEAFGDGQAGRREGDRTFQGLHGQCTSCTPL